MPQACGRVMKRPAAPGADACERADVGDLVGPALTPARAPAARRVSHQASSASAALASST